ncbi:MAG: flagellar hook-associated protein FlgL [Hydrogenophaga sp.]|uniref:flagellar hook-associated protein FlgL n=1 Tax=Hydrogenophaga sp. TaxID=1904254 RepID=UPI001DCCC0D2|nr:flagellar hook-associated protein FlgL [Hydrogenophaga sp.]MBX3609721.1 flagellar hook-associated protein FlgL [Hydrogenophaga sp.]
MSFRIATANQFDRTVFQLGVRQSELATQQERLATGKRVMKASDDPVAATLAEASRNRASRLEADLRALQASRTSLQQAESGLAESSDLMIKVRELMVSAGNGSYTDSERADIARQLEGLREQLLAVANRTDSNGRTLYGGLGGASVPFVDLYGPSGSGVTFQGLRGQPAPGDTSLPQTLDGEAIWMKVPAGNGSFTLTVPNNNGGNVSTSAGEVIDATLTTGNDYRIDFSVVAGTTQYTLTNVTTGTPVAGHVGVPYQNGGTIQFDGVSITLNGAPANGDRVDMTANTGPTDVFTVVQNAIDALRFDGPGEAGYRQQELARAMTEIDNAHDRVLLARGRVGEWLNRADAQEQLMSDRQVDLEVEQSNLTDLDMVKGISDFQKQQTALEAAIKSYAQVQRLSLFNQI